MDKKTDRKLVLANDIFFSQVWDFLDEGKEVAFPVRGNSMRPFLHEGDKVVVKSVDDSELKIGYIALAFTSYGYMLHRIADIKKDDVILVGDANLVQKETAAYKDILGIVIRASRNGREMNVYSSIHLLAAKCWYYARPFRLVLYKVRRLFIKC